MKYNFFLYKEVLDRNVHYYVRNLSSLKWSLYMQQYDMFTGTPCIVRAQDRASYEVHNL